jgi:hypothetical protein
MCTNTEQVACSLQGVLAQAKYGDELFCEEKFHAANGKAQTCSQGALISFLLRRGGGGVFNFCPFQPMGRPKVALLFFLSSF